MIDKDLLEDLLSFEIKVLFLGDRGQLEPIGEKTKLLNKPDAELTEIHRQAKDNPIIYLSMLAREGKNIPPGRYGKSVFVISKDTINEKNNEKIIDMANRADQMICGKNSTREYFNNAIREKKGIKSPLPVYGEKMICLRNNWNKTIEDISLVNGIIGYITEIEQQVVALELSLIKNTSQTCLLPS